MRERRKTKMSAETSTKRKNRLSVWIDDFKAKSLADRRRVITDMLFNNAMYIIILIAIVYIAIRVPAFLSRSSIINIISLTAAKLPIALGIGGAIVLTEPIYRRDAASDLRHASRHRCFR